jgi:hypothetical protein
MPLRGKSVFPLVHPDMYALPWADKSFGPDEKLTEPERQARLASIVAGYLAVARKLAAD